MLDPDPHGNQCGSELLQSYYPWTLSRLSGATIPHWQKFSKLTILEAFLFEHLQYIYLNPFKGCSGFSNMKFLNFFLDWRGSFDLSGSGFGFPNRIRWNNWIRIRNVGSIAVTNLSLNIVRTVRCHDPSLVKVLKTDKFGSFLDRHNRYNIFLKPF